MDRSTLAPTGQTRAPSMSLAQALAGAGAIAFAGIQLDSAAITIAYRPSSPVPVDQFSFPWSGETETATDLTRGLSALFLLVAIVQFARTATATCGRLGRLGAGLAIAGAVSFLLAYLGSILASGQTTGQPLAVVATVLFAAATVLTALGMIIAGAAMIRRGRWTSWRRYTPIAVGVAMAMIAPLQSTALLAVLVVIYSLVVAAFGVAILMEPQT